MAVKVMVAPAIVNGEARSELPAGRRRRDPAAGKPRRRSAVYDADGNEVFITLMCQKCRTMKPLGQFGLRRMADGAIRNQPWCKTCRSASPAVRSREAGEASPSGDSLAAAPQGGAAAKPVSAAAIAAEVAAAIVWNK